MEEHKPGCGNGQFLLTLPSCTGTSLIYEEMAQALYLSFPVSLQNCAGWVIGAISYVHGLWPTYYVSYR